MQAENIEKPDVPEVNENNTDEQGNSGNEKSFTQAELDKVVSERLARESKKYPTKEEMAEYEVWKSKQEPKEKPEDEISKELELAKKEALSTKAELELHKATAKPEFIEFLSSKLTSMDGELKDNVDKLKKESPQYFGIAEKTKKVSSSPKLGGSVDGKQTINEKMNSILRGGN